MTLLNDLTNLLGAQNVLTGDDIARYREDWTKLYPSNPCAVARPGTTEEVAETLRIAARHDVAVVPVAGLTGLTGGAQTNGGLMIRLSGLIKSVN